MNPPSHRGGTKHIPTLGSREALFRFATISLMDEIDPFLAAFVNIKSTCVSSSPNCPCPRALRCFGVTRGMAGRWHDGGKKYNSHLEVAADEELASHGD